MPHRKVSEIFQDRSVITVTPRATVQEAAKTMQQARVGAVMVVENGRLTGIFTERDALFRVLAAGRDAASTLIAEVMTPDPLCIKPDQLFGHALHLMHDNGFRHVPVVANGWPVGMISARDALSSELQNFEQELVRREEIAEILG